MHSEREAIQRLIRAIESLDREDGHEDTCEDTVGREEWSETKMAFMRKYGHIK